MIFWRDNFKQKEDGLMEEEYQCVNFAKVYVS